jgi:hypothetical protein
MSRNSKNLVISFKLYSNHFYLTAFLKFAESNSILIHCDSFRFEKLMIFVSFFEPNEIEFFNFFLLSIFGLIKQATYPLDSMDFNAKEFGRTES